MCTCVPAGTNIYVLKKWHVKLHCEHQYSCKYTDMKKIN